MDVNVPGLWESHLSRWSTRRVVMTPPTDCVFGNATRRGPGVPPTVFRFRGSRSDLSSGGTSENGLREGTFLWVTQRIYIFRGACSWLRSATCMTTPSRNAAQIHRPFLPNARTGTWTTSRRWRAGADRGETKGPTMTADELDREYARQLTAMAAAAWSTKTRGTCG